MLQAILAFIWPLIRPSAKRLGKAALKGAVKLARDFMREAEEQRKGGGSFTNDEKREWVRAKLRAITVAGKQLRGRDIDLVLGIAIQRHLDELEGTAPEADEDTAAEAEAARIPADEPLGDGRISLPGTKSTK